MRTTYASTRSSPVAGDVVNAIPADAWMEVDLRSSDSASLAALEVRFQKAVDAAALAGAVFMPENAGNKAFTTAQSISSQNGFTNGSNGVTVTTAAGKLPNQLKVTVSINTKNPWGAMVGYNNTTIVRSAVAEYQLPQNLGSPQNSYGNDPESAFVHTAKGDWRLRRAIRKVVRSPRPPAGVVPRTGL